MKEFKDYVLLKEEADKNWRKHFVQLEKGFVPPSKMRSIIEAFLKSSEIELTTDTTKSPTMPKKSLFLVGGPVRDFILNKTVKDFDLATNATPEQVAHILSNAGFKMSPERSGKEGKPLNFTFKPEEAGPGDKKTWFVKGRDSSPERKVFVISAVVDGEEFEIATFRKDAKVTDGEAEVDFVDNPLEDASRRDLTINAMYIELSKPDGENSKLFDPTGKGLHDVKSKKVRTVGPAEDRFREDKLRVMRAIRFHCRFGSDPKMDADIEKALPKFRNLEGVALERIRDEFLKGLLHPDVDTRCYLGIYRRTGLLQKVFPDLIFDSPSGVPVDWTDKKDKPLALAWLLQHNPIEKINAALSGLRDGTPTGWSTEEKRAIIFLLKLKQFDPHKVTEYMRERQGTGLSNDQVRDWVDMFKINGTNRDRRPWWAQAVRKYSEHKPSVRWADIENSPQNICPNCKGAGCATCGHDGKLPMHMRGQLLSSLETEKFLEKLPKNG